MWIVPEVERFYSETLQSFWLVVHPSRDRFQGRMENTMFLRFLVLFEMPAVLQRRSHFMDPHLLPFFLFSTDSKLSLSSGFQL